MKTSRFRLNRLPALLFFAVGLLVFGLRFEVVMVVGNSMEPTFGTSDILLVDTWAYRNDSIRRGDVLVARRGNELVVKRVVALPNEDVEIRAGMLVVNSHMVVEPYPVQEGVLSIGRGHLNSGRYAIVGDNRNLFVQETIFGVVGRQDIVGRATFSLRPAQFLTALFGVIAAPRDQRQ